MTAPLAPGRFAFAAMLTGSACLAFGPWLVRLADTGLIASAFWRLALAVPALFLLAWLADSPIRASARMMRATALAGLFFAGDLAVWHLGIVRTTMANATLLANAATFLLPLYGLVALRRRPSRPALIALGLAAAGTGLLVGQSAQASVANVVGDLLCLAAAVFYTGYLVVMDRVRAGADALPGLAWATLFGALALAPLLPFDAGPLLPGDWTPILALAIGSQVVGQGLIIFAVRHLSPVVVGLCLLIQPVISATLGALRFGEIPGPWEATGALLVVAALLLVRVRPRATP